MKRLTLIIALTMAVAPAVAFNEPDDFRGVPWGANEATLKEKHPGQTCMASQDRRMADRACVDRFTVGRVAVTAVWSFRADQLVRVSLVFPSTDFSTMEATFTERYGPPTTTGERAVQNRMGATFENRIHQWTGSRIYIRLERYGTKLTTGSAQLALKSEFEQFQKEEEQERKKGAGQL